MTGNAPRMLMAAAAICLATVVALAQPVPVMENLRRLEGQEDTDGDHKITIHDHVTPFDIRDRNGAPVRPVSGVCPLSILLQELKRAEDSGRDEVALAAIGLDEPILDRTRRLIRDRYWDALTRQIDAEHLDKVTPDAKIVSREDYLYVAGSDEAAIQYFEALERGDAQRQRWPTLKVVALPAPEKISGNFVRGLDGRHGLVALKLRADSPGGPLHGVPYVVPGGRFNELYYWDSYFIVLGLLQDGRRDLARGMADNLLYEMERFGRIPNANRTYYLTRSQPPFLTSIIRALYQSGAGDRSWLESALRIAMREYQNVWMSGERLVSLGSSNSDFRLSRYIDSGSGPCPEVEPGHYDETLAPWLAAAQARGAGSLTPYRFLNEFLYCGNYADLKVDGQSLSSYFANDRAERESGHDTTHRFDDRATEFLPVDLNALLYRYEMDFAELLEKEFGGKLPGEPGPSANAAYWREEARRRKQAMLELMWDDARGFFFDYDIARRRRSDYISPTGLYPLWARLLDKNEEREAESARRTAAFAREKLEQRAGLAASARESVAAARRGDARQWDYPYGWPPHQMLAWEGLRNYGIDEDAERLAYRWLFTILSNARDYNGTIPEKYNVVTGSHEVFVEYGNVGTKFDYIAPEGFGWMNASLEVGVTYLSERRLQDLRDLKPPK